MSGMLRRFTGLCALLMAAGGSLAAARDMPGTNVERIPLANGLVLVSVLQFPDGDRENVVSVERLTASGAYYAWQFSEYRDGQLVDQGMFRRFVRAEDFASATRLHTLYRSDDRADYPGYTAFSLSSAVYERLRAEGEAPFSVIDWSGGGALGKTIGDALGGTFGSDLLGHLVRLRGTLRLASEQPEPFPLLLNGKRVTVPALRLLGRFTYQQRSVEAQYQVLADPGHPLLLRMVHGDDVWQLVRVEDDQAGNDEDDAASVEQTLETDCRADLPGVYFAFGTAALQPASQSTLAEVADVLARHPAWTLTVEGHTDNVGGDAFNLALSQARAEAVREWLVRQHGVAGQRLDAVGFGAAQPRDSNATVEGRAHNRRVELARACPE